jgi:hypothetical protein
VVSGRILKGALVVAALALAGIAATACPAAHSGTPGRSCVERADCFAGEICDTTTQQCVPRPPDLATAPSATPDLSTAPLDDLLPPTGDAL